jgi:hypothetical protein
VLSAGLEQGWMCVADSCPDNLVTLYIQEKQRSQYCTTIHLRDTTIKVTNRKGNELLTMLRIVAATCNQNKEHQAAENNAEI